MEIGWLKEFNAHLSELEKEYDLTDLETEDDKYDDNSYWNKIGQLSVFGHNMNANGYHFLYEIKGLSSQILFGLKASLLFNKLRSNEKGKPNIYNHRYTFLLESTIHGVYAYWNRVALLLNYYLVKKFDKKRS
ncbi:hypothetical protein GCM10011386_36070 [Parapedobacter defluvii]|uniref:Uncharacterized protein n=1 Tax=Parapedobacter defluvii TaxID=2045106 RepID=A0ABQ1MIJ0_9SPHI|nr:hypothetical protein [Parapedobacter defluvii]GGC40818.1 hypothetical protein GCM10011386_36070 [Parapedobacter defluvii]